MAALKKKKTTLPELRKIQVSALSEVKNIFKEQQIAVLAICPGGGKTIASLYEIMKYVKQKKRVLILTHGTNVLKNQWAEELKTFGIKFGTSVVSKEKIVIALPQSVKSQRSKMLDFDLLVVDEAHEFYYAAMVQKIVGSLKPTAKQLLLTGTPSPFIAKGLKPVVVSAVEAFEEKVLTDTYFGLVKGSFKIANKHYNEEKDVVSTFTETRNEIFASMENTMDKLLKRVSKKSVDGTIDTSKLEKTMFAARNIKQANLMREFLESKGVAVTLSTFRSDVDSVEIERFKREDNLKVLIVVRRGILGFNMPELVNLVDFTGSRNINRIYQLYARVLRVHPAGKQKNFFKICNALNPGLDALYMKAALCLANKDFISNFNGRNLEGCSVVIPNKYADRLNGRSGGDSSGSSDGVSFEDLIDLDLLDEIRTKIFYKKNKGNKEDVEYQSISFGEIVGKLKATSFTQGVPGLPFSGTPETVTKKFKIIEMAKNGEPRPSRTAGSRETRALGFLLFKSVNPSQNRYDEAFVQELKKVSPGYLLRDGGKREELIEIAKRGESRPTRQSKNPKTVKLATALIGYTTKGKNRDPKFEDLIKELAPHWFFPKKPQGRKVSKSKASPKNKPASVRVTEPVDQTAQKSPGGAPLKKYVWKGKVFYR